MSPKPVARCSETGGRSFVKALHVAAWTALLYGVTFWWLARPAAEPPSSSPTPPAAAAELEDFIRPVNRPAPAPTPAARPAPNPRPVERAPQVAARTVPDEEPEPQTWSHPDYTEAIRLLRRADADFQRFLQEREQALLDDIDPNCRRAIELLEGLGTEAPAQARVGERIRQAYQLIHNSRQARVMAR